MSLIMPETSPPQETTRNDAIASRRSGAELAIVIPTFNERDNIEPLLRRIDDALAGVNWEVVFVDDDSTDGTSDAIRTAASRDSRVRCIQRIGRRGLATACIEGVLATAAPYFAVMDADLQHDETLLPAMFDTLRSEPLDLVVGSRYVAGGSVGEWSETRTRMSGLATRLSRHILKAEVADPMSGFFMMRRDAFNRAVRKVSGIGFKILMDLFASSPSPLRFKELPYQFRNRERGESKLDSMVVWEYAMLIADKLVGHIVPPRFLSFSVVGGFGLVVHNLVLFTAHAALESRFGMDKQTSFEISLATATFVAMICNFVLNNVLTYRDMRLKGWALVKGFFSFFLICALGALANVGMGSLLYERGYGWWLAGGVAGPIVSAVWNYAVSSVFTWRRKSSF